MRRLLGIAGLWAVGACECTNVDDQVFACAATEQCLSGFECVAGRCRTSGGTGGGSAGGAAGGSVGGGAQGGGDAGGAAGGAAGGLAGGGGGATGGGVAGGAAGGTTGGGSAGGTAGGVAGGSAGGTAGGAGGTGGAGGGTCVASVLIAASNINQSALIDDGTLRALWVARRGGSVLANVVNYAECTAGCTTQSPTFSTLAYDAGGLVTHLSVEPRSGRGFAAAAVVVPTTGSSPDLFYVECSTQCLTASSWTWVRLETNIEPGRPDLAVYGKFTGIAYGNNTDTWYRECGANCDLAASWVGDQVSGENVNDNVGLTMIDAGPGDPLHVIVTESGVGLNCVSGCTTKTNWNNGNAVPQHPDTNLILSPTVPVRLIGSVGNGIRFDFSNDADTWVAGPPVATNLDFASRIDLDVERAGTPSVVFGATTGYLRQARLPVPDGGWVVSDVLACGAPVFGLAPSQLTDPLRLIYSTGTEVRFTAP